VTLQEESDAVGTTVVTDHGLTETVHLLKDEFLLGFSKKIAGAESGCGCREWVLSGFVARWSSALVDQMTIHIFVQDAGDKCLVGNAFF
jgi:hypothetical protein